MRIKSFIILLIAVSLTFVSGFMNVAGYISLYAQQSLLLVSLFIFLELAKAGIFGIVLVHGRIQHKIPLIILAVLLICVSFLGHLSYLSQAYNSNKAEIENNTMIQQAITGGNKELLESIDSQLLALKEEKIQYTEELNLLRNNINSYETAEEKNDARKQVQGRINRLNNDIKNANNKIAELAKEKALIVKDNRDSIQELSKANVENANRSVFIYTAELFGIHVDKLANIINIMLSIVIDSLALIMLWVAGGMLEDSKNKTVKKKVEDTIVEIVPPGIQEKQKKQEDLDWYDDTERDLSLEEQEHLKKLEDTLEETAEEIIQNELEVLDTLDTKNPIELELKGSSNFNKKDFALSSDEIQRIKKLL